MATNSSSSILDALHPAIEAAIRARFPDFATVEFYREPGAEGLATPACLLAMTRCDRSKDKDDGSGQMQALLRFEARVVVAAATTDAALQLRKAAVALAGWLHQLGRFPGAASGAIDVIAALPEDTAAAQPGLRTWLVEWSLPVALGSNAWEETGGAVPQAFYSFVPEIGRDHEARYQPIEGAAP
ncbi:MULTISPECIES: hypothetical protein [Stenotrophomonas]|jgi:hypothetical protein|uniref:hypothetical protein n=1 Tax=Stenotrophomonas TaxID=40323 RepID=UPI00200BB171|nr:MULTISPECIES: hypothetical protein [Stenotrophomonas]MBN5091271.1 hypothetical protein [Stenotrophomonas maltophilia]UQA23544.1 hypothetical protein M1L61_05010 [Stenotrophomonas sp. NY11291]